MSGLLLVLLAALLTGGPAFAQDLRIERGRPTRVGRATPQSSTVSIAQFEFAPASGAGMGTACSGTNPTGSLGETITYPARASNRTCMKGGEFSGIANGDMVILSANQYAVQPGGDGTGPLGISVWTSGKNWASGSEALNGADWTAYGSGAGAPTVTANYAVGPDGATVAERIEAAAVTSGQASFVYSTGCPSGTITLSAFVRGTSASGTTEMGWGGGGGGWATAPVSFVSTSWTRVVMPGASPSGASLLAIGNMGSQSGNARDAVDVLVTGVQCESGYAASPYMPTAIGGTATRAAESAPTIAYTASGSTLSIGATTAARVFHDDVPAAVSLSFDFGNEAVLPIVGSKVRCDFGIAGTHSYVYARDNLQTPTATAAACAYTAGAGRSACLGSTCRAVAGSLTLPTGSATIRIGGLQDAGVANATIKKVCVDSSGTLCRPSGYSDVTCPVSTTEANTAAMIGTSIMVGSGAIPILLVDELSDKMCAAGRTAASFAVSGAKIAAGANNCTTQYTTGVQGHAYRAVLSNCGINDILAGTGGPATWALYETLLNTILGDGFFIVAGLLTPCSGYAGCDATAIASFNASLTAKCAANPSTMACRDQHLLVGTGSTETYSTSPLTTDVLSSTCRPNTDWLHPNDFCSVMLADDFYAGTP